MKETSLTAQTAITTADQVAQKGARILEEVEKAAIGKREFLEKILCAVFADGHVLIEDFPGLAGRTDLYGKQDRIRPAGLQRRHHDV